MSPGDGSSRKRARKSPSSTGLSRTLPWTDGLPGGSAAEPLYGTYLLRRGFPVRDPRRVHLPRRSSTRHDRPSRSTKGRNPGVEKATLREVLRYPSARGLPGGSDGVVVEVCRHHAPSTPPEPSRTLTRLSSTMPGLPEGVEGNFDVVSDLTDPMRARRRASSQDFFHLVRESSRRAGDLRCRRAGVISSSSRRPLQDPVKPCHGSSQLTSL